MHASDNLDGRFASVGHKLKSSVNMLGMAGLVPLVLDIERINLRGALEAPELVSSLTADMEGVQGPLPGFERGNSGQNASFERTAPRVKQHTG